MEPEHPPGQDPPAAFLSFLLADLGREPEGQAGGSGRAAVGKTAGVDEKAQAGGFFLRGCFPLRDITAASMATSTTSGPVIPDPMQPTARQTCQAVPPTRLSPLSSQLDTQGPDAEDLGVGTKNSIYCSCLQRTPKLANPQAGVGAESSSQSEARL